MRQLDSNSHEKAAWHPLKCIGFRTLLIYFVLYTFPFPLDRLPWIEDAIEPVVQQAWESTAQWVGNHVLGIEGEIPTAFTGSGDRTYDYILLVISVVVTLGATAVWSMLDRKP